MHLLDKFRRNKFPRGSPQNPVKLKSLKLVRMCPCGLEVKLPPNATEEDFERACLKKCREFKRKTKK